MKIRATVSIKLSEDIVNQGLAMGLSKNQIRKECSIQLKHLLQKEVSEEEEFFDEVLTEIITNAGFVQELHEINEAENILQDLLDERGGDIGELYGMDMEDALDTVETYGHKGSNAKKIAKELVSMCNESAVNEEEKKKE